MGFPRAVGEGQAQSHGDPGRTGKSMSFCASEGRVLPLNTELTFPVGVARGDLSFPT